MFNEPISIQTIDFLIPEILIAFAAIGIFLGGVFFNGRRLWIFLAAVAIVLAGGHIVDRLPVDANGSVTYVFKAVSFGSVGTDAFGFSVRMGSLAVGLLFVILSACRGRDLPTSEATGALLLVTCGLMLVGSAEELVMLFLGLEMISIPTYLLLFLGQRENGSDLSRHEATSKYFFLSVLSSAILLYGFSFLYGITGELHLDRITTALAEGNTAGPLPVLALLLIMGGLGFKIAAVPFHFYAPDVYQGTTNFNAGLLSVVPKIAGVVVLIRLVAAVLPADLAQVGWQLCLVLSVLTMTLGNVAALWQNNLRRMLAYSSIAHAGYMLIGLCVFLAARSLDSSVAAVEHPAGLVSLLVYLAVYVAATLGTFAAFVNLGDAEQTVDRVEQLAGLSKSRPLVAAAIAVFMFSLAGIPPLAGFWGKLGLFYSALSVNTPTDLAIAGLPMRTALMGLAIIGALNAAIAAGYYLRIIATMYFQAPMGSSIRATSAAGRSPAPAFVMGICMFLVVALGCRPGWLVQQSQNATSAALRVPSSSESADAIETATDTVETAYVEPTADMQR